MSDVGLTARTRAGGGFAARAGAAPYVAAVFLSAALVFLVQPMFAKMAMPLLGGAPAVWNVSLVCFQTALLGGYAYAHALARLPYLKVQVSVHAALLLLAALALPLSVSGLFGSPDPAHPVLWLAGTFLVSIAPPFAIISATAPLIQNWYARTGRADAADPYHLYAASNVGSLFGLAAYPLLMEPLATLTQQTGIWAVLYGCLALLLIGCGLLAARAPHVPTSSDRTAAEAPLAVVSATLWRERLYWLVLAAVPSGLLLGVSGHISTDVAAAPFLWAPPLMAYIGTFIIVFSKKPLISHVSATRYMPYAVAVAALLIAWPHFVPMPLVVFTHVLALFMAALCLHGALAARRPSADRLTEFYLIMSAGGVIGAAFPALIAPIVFNGVYEYPLLLGAALLMRPSTQSLRTSVASGRYMILACMMIAAIFLLAAGMGHMVDRSVVNLVLVLLFTVAVLQVANRLITIAALGTLVMIGWSTLPAINAASQRGFFGVIKTVDIPRENIRLMLHGTTLHGSQRLSEGSNRTPLSYYHISTPIGQAFTALRSTAHTVGVVGLGVGSVACHAQPGQQFTFYEIDPLVAHVAKDTSRFTFLSSCTPDAPIILGDARLSLRDATPGAYDLLLLDAFSSDSIPVHLLTREAMALYLSRLSDEGVLVFHISNRHLDLMPTVARIGAAEGAVMISQRYHPTQEAVADGAVGSEVVILAKSAAALTPFKDDPRWTVLEADSARAWTDDYSNVVGAMFAHYRKR